MLFSLLKHGKNQEIFLADQELCHEISDITLQIAAKEMQALVAKKALRLPVSEVNPKSLERFDPKTIAEHQRTSAPLITSILRTCAGSDTSSDASNDETDLPGVNVELGDETVHENAYPRGRDRNQIATISLCMLCYAQNQQSNVLQMTTGYFAYADNTSKRMVEILHRMGLLVTYETVRNALKSNAEAISKELQEKAWNRRFFVSFDNMNFYKNRRDQRLHNKAVMIHYIAGYVCFMPLAGDEEGEAEEEAEEEKEEEEEEAEEEANWEKRYLDASQIDYSAVNSLVAQDFILDSNDLSHQAHLARHMISKVLAEYFPTSIYKDKRRHSDGRLLPRYKKWPAPLSDIQCQRSVDLVPLSTLPIDEASIAGTIEILKAYLQRLGLEDTVVEEKCIMFKGDFLTVRNIRRAIYRWQEEPRSIHSTTWGKKSDKISLARFQMGLKRKNASPDAKDFHACDDFFRTVVKSFVLVLCMHGAGCSEIALFKAWLSTNDWPEMIQKIEETDLGAFKPVERHSAVSPALRSRISEAIEQQKKDWLAGREQDCSQGKNYSYKRQPDWEKKEENLLKAEAKVEHDVVRDNALLLINLGLLYLDFVDACRGGYSGRVEKCIQCFAVVFQGSTARNYAGECLHLVACLKKVWKPGFRAAWLDHCLINPSGRQDKFYPDDRFGETIIKLNKEKVRPSANAKTDRFLRETIAPNVLTLWKCKKVMAKVLGATDHGNRHKVVETYHDVMHIMRLLLLEDVFTEKPGRGSSNSANEEGASTDLFLTGTAALAGGVPLRNYIRRARGNWKKSLMPAGEGEEEGQALFDDNTDDLVENIPNDPNEYGD